MTAITVNATSVITNVLVLDRKAKQRYDTDLHLKQGQVYASTVAIEGKAMGEVTFGHEFHDVRGAVNEEEVEYDFMVEAELPKELLGQIKPDSRLAIFHHRVGSGEDNHRVAFLPCYRSSKIPTDSQVTEVKLLNFMEDGSAVDFYGGASLLEGGSNIPSGEGCGTFSFVSSALEKFTVSVTAPGSSERIADICLSIENKCILVVFVYGTKDAPRMGHFALDTSMDW